ncbi:MAG: DUF881 domain-containing protein [Clostridiaceae bacterium]|nr:DUF881 domain-containing protein [Clostridiaceae bacterium]
MTKNKEPIRIAIAFILIISGFILGRHFIQIRSEADSTLNLAAIQEARLELVELQKVREDLETDYKKLRKELNDLWYEVIDTDDEEQLKSLDKLAKTREIAGLTEVKGNGVIVTVNDKENYDPLEDPVESLIHDQNIIYLVDLLVDNGAQAVSINNLRIVNSSQIFCVGTTVLCNNQRTIPPYEIKAIGPQEQLKAALDTDPLYLKLQEAPYFVRFSSELANDLVINEYETPGTIAKDIEYLKIVTDPEIQKKLE